MLSGQTCRCLWPLGTLDARVEPGLVELVGDAEILPQREDRFPAGTGTRWVVRSAIPSEPAATDASILTPPLPGMDEIFKQALE